MYSYKVSLTNRDKKGLNVKYYVLAEGEDEAIEKGFSRLKEETSDWKKWFCDGVERAAGGYRPGGGRPKGSKKLDEPTKAVRLPESIAIAAKSGKIEELLELINEWREREKEASTTSPRWDQLRVFLNELKEMGI